MANRKLIYNNASGSITELASGSGNTAVYYDDTLNTIVTKNVAFTALASSTVHGLPIISGSSGSVRQAQSFDVVAWNPNLYGANKGGWTLVPGQDIDLSIGSFPASSNADVSGNMGSNPKVVNLSNVSRGGPLSASYGGTGLGINDYQNIKEALFLGDGTNKLQLLTASADNSTKYAVSTDTNNIIYSVRGDSNVTSSTEVSIYTSSATWARTSNVKAIRVLLQGGGGGGGSGANRNNYRAATGGGGGSSGGFLDSGIIYIDKNFDNIPVVVGTGGVGGNFSSTNSVGNAGLNGGSSSFGSFFYVSGGLGGSGGVLTSSNTAGGASVTYGTRNLFSINDSNLISDFKSDAGDSGGSSSLTTGENETFSTSSTDYYGAGGGAGAGSLLPNLYNFSYNGGNAGTQVSNRGITSSVNALSAQSSSILSLIKANVSSDSQFSDLFVSSGGGGGASLSSSLNSRSPLALFHFENNLSDSSINSYTLLTSSIFSLSTTQTKFGTYSLSSSYSAVAANTSSLNAPFIPRTSDFTVHFWAYLANSGSSGAAPSNTQKGNGGNYAPASYLFYLGEIGGFIAGAANTTNGQHKVGVYNNLAPTYYYTASNNVPTASYNKWVHYGFVKTGSFINIYVDGTGSTNSIPANADITAQNNYIAGAGNSLYNPNGFIDEFAIIPYALSAAEIANLVNNPSAIADPIKYEDAGGIGSNGAWGSGGGGGGASSYVTGSSVGTRQGGNGGNGYVAVISYKY